MMYLFLILTIKFALTNCSPPPIAYTSKGAVKGFLNEHLDGSITSNFLGIPYARPPVGELRFQRPQPPPDFDELYEATEWKNSCMQNYQLLENALPEDLYRRLILSQTYGEDCLQLNIFYPGDFVERDENEKIPVMVWIFGGGFTVGSANFPVYDCNILALETGNIVVSIDYRLGVFGNLYIENAPGYNGNMGLYDQRMALQWIQENIRAFGGDPEAVTLFGESAGSYSVQAHVVSPGSAGLFQRAIGQSGNLNRFLPVTKEAGVRTANNLLNATNCFEGSNTERLNCLRAIPAETMLNISNVVGDNTGSRFTIISDGDFIPEDYLSRINNGHVNKVPSIWGTNPLESSVFLPSIAPDALNSGMTAEQTEGALQFSIRGFTNKEAAYDALIGFYFPSGIGNDVWNNLDKSARMISDIWFEGPKALALDGMEKTEDVFEYYFIRRPPFEDDYRYNIGAHHADEVLYIFGAFLPGGFFEGNGTSADVSLSKSIIKAWGSFAQTGQPIYLDSNGSEYTWPKYDSDSRKYLRFDVNMTKETAESRSLWTENKEFITKIFYQIN